MTFNEHANTLAGKRVVDFQRGEPLTDPDTTVPRLRVGYDDDFTAVDLLHEVLADPAAERLSGLVIGAWASEMYEVTPAEIVETLVAAAPQLASLTALFVGDMVVEENEVSWIHQCDLSPLWQAFPRLEHLQIRGTEGLSLGKIEHGMLKKLILESGGLPRSVLQEVAAAKLPALEHLEVYLGDSGYGWDGTVEDLQPLLEANRFPKLKYLGLRDSEIADAVAAAVAQAPVLSQLEVLDLSLGTLGDEGGRALLASPGIRRLKRLDLHHHYLSDDVMQELQRLPLEVDLNEQESEGQYGRYVSISE
jgi:hypothetical protein